MNRKEEEEKMLEHKRAKQRPKRNEQTRQAKESTTINDEAKGIKSMLINKSYQLHLCTNL